MNTHFANRTIYYINPQIPKLILDEILNQCKDLTYESSLTGEGSTNKRTSKQSWICWDTWIAGIMHNLFISANNDYFEYDLNHFDSGIQATKYEVGEHYDWHIDQLRTNYKYTRKLSMTFLLNDEFTGGDLQICDPTTKEEITVDMTPGSVCIFPSWVLHRVKPVKSGTRYSLVAWMNGTQFK